MSNIAISVRSLTKTYKLYQQPIDRLKEALHPLKKSYHKKFNALDHISFEIKHGETVGIVGCNGSGKSTLLKVITGVLTPTSGHAIVHGRVSAILELGAGFNSEMTGLENIYLNNTINGISEFETKERVQQIVDFAELGDFIHQPLKTYSSGMKARLAFAVAINVEPDILIVDEALSVGDAAFQNKCVRKMEEIGEKGITILFVSHDTQIINKFCNKVVWINDGKIKEQGQPDIILENYMSYMSYGSETIRSEKEQEDNKSSNVNYDKIGLINVSGLASFGEKKALIERVGFLDQNGQLITTLKQAENVSFVCEFSTSIDLHDVAIGVLFRDTLNNEILTFNSYMYDVPIDMVTKNTTIRTTINFKVPKLYPREYLVTVALSEGTQINHVQQHWIHSAMTINIMSCDFIDGCMFSLYPNEIEYKYEQV